MKESYYMAFKFLVEVLAASGIYAHTLPRRRKYGRNIALCIAVSCVISAQWSRELAASVPFSIIRYLVLLALVIATVYAGFDVSVKTACLCGISGYATQHFCVKSFGIWERFLPSGDTMAGEFAVYILFTLAVYGVFFFLLGRRPFAEAARHVKTSETIALGLVLLLFGTTYSVMAGHLAVTDRVSETLLDLYAMLCSTMLLMLLFGLLQKGQLVDEMEAMEYIRRQEKQQFLISRETIDLINIKCHDLKHQIGHLEGIPGDVIRELKERISIYDASVRTGNKTLDIILMEKGLYCESRDIRLTCMGNGEALSFMSNSDLYSFFGNAIDNAIEAVQSLEEREKRYVHVMLREAKGMLLIHVENFFQEEPRWDEEGELVTSKDDRAYHGFGVKSIRYITEKYKGELQVRTEKDLFILEALFPL